MPKPTGPKAGQAAQVGDAFGVPGSDERAAVAGADRLDVARPIEVVGVGRRLGEAADGGCTLGRADRPW